MLCSSSDRCSTRDGFARARTLGAEDLGGLHDRANLTIARARRSLPKNEIYTNCARCSIRTTVRFQVMAQRTKAKHLKPHQAFFAPYMREKHEHLSTISLSPGMMEDDWRCTHGP